MSRNFANAKDRERRDSLAIATAAATGDVSDLLAEIAAKKEQIRQSVCANNDMRCQLKKIRAALDRSPHKELYDAAAEVLRVYSYVNADHVEECGCGLCRLTRATRP